MGRPRLPRKSCCKVKCSCFVPEGAKKLGDNFGIKLLADELEALNLHDVSNLDQTQASIKMGVSQPTFARILKSAHHKIAEALIKGELIHLNSCKCKNG
jgi:uncharacterized protein